MFPKEHSVEYVKTALTFAWYKLYYPAEFYAVTFNVRFPEVDCSFLCGELEAINLHLKDLVDKELLLFKECAERGIAFEYNENALEPYSVFDGKILLNY